MSIIQELRRHRVLVAIALVVSIAFGLEVAYSVSPGIPPKLSSRQHDVGVASARVLVDTPHSVVAEVNPAGSDSLQIHGQLLADLIATDTVRASIARSAGIPVQRVVVIPPKITAPIPTPLAQVAPPPVGAATVAIAADATLPVVAINVTAANGREAGAIANGTVSAIRSYLGSVASAQKIPASQQVVITALGSAQAGETSKGRSPIFGAFAALVLFAVLCYMIVFFTRVRGRAREIGAPEAVPPVAAAPPAPPEPVEAPPLAAAIERAGASATPPPHPSPTPTRQREDGQHDPAVPEAPRAPERVAHSSAAHAGRPHALSATWLTAGTLRGLLSRK